MATTPVALASSLPTATGAGFDFWRMFLRVAPVAETFQVLNRIVHVVAVAMMHLTASRLAAPLAGAIRKQALRGAGSASARARLSLWV